MKKFSFKSIAFLMSLIMVFSIFAPVVASAVEFYEHEHEHDDGVLHYVSIGDSMTNGYGLDGYERSEEEGPLHTYAPNGGDHDAMYNVNGYLREVIGSYPVLFQEYLARKNGWDEDPDTINDYADLTQLGTSALRAEDIWYILTYDSEHDTAAWPGDGYTEYRIDIWDDVVEDNRADHTGYTIPEMHEHYTTAIKDADVISLNVGANNFSTFMVERIKDFFAYTINGDTKYQEGENGGRVPYDSNPTTSNWDYIKAHLTVELERDLSELYTKLEALSKNLIADMNLPELLADNGFADAEIQKMMEKLIKDLLDAAMYTSAGFAIAYDGIIDQIEVLNPDAEIVIIGLNNWMKGMNVEVADDVWFPVGDVLDTLYHFANVYMAAIPAAHEADEDCELSFYYADVEGKVEMIVAEVAKGDASTLTRKRLADGVWWFFEAGGDNQYDATEELNKVDSNIPVTREFDVVLTDQDHFIDGVVSYLDNYKDYGVTLRDFIIKGCELLDEHGDAIEDYKTVVGDAVITDRDEFMSKMVEVALAGETFDQDNALTVFGLSAMEKDAYEKATSLYASDDDLVAERETLKNLLGLSERVKTCGCSACGPRVELSVEDVLYDLELYYTFERSYKDFAFLGEASLSTFLFFHIFQPAFIPQGVTNAMNLMKTTASTNPFFAEEMVEVWNTPEYREMATVSYLLVNYYSGAGVACHPSKNGHATIAAEMIKAYEGDVSATDYIVDELKALYEIVYADADVQAMIGKANAYIDVAIDAIEDAKVAVDAYGVDAKLEDTKALLLEELDLTIETLKKAQAALAEDFATVDGAWAAILSFRDDLAAHLEKINAIALSIGYEIDPYVANAYNAVVFYAEVVEEIINRVYEKAVAINDAYLAFVEYAGAIADKIDPELGKAVRAYLIDTPADALAIIYAYGEEAVMKFITDAAVAAGDIYNVVLGLAALIEEYGEEIFYIVKNTDEYDVLVKEIKDTVAALKAFKAEEKAKEIIKGNIAELEAELEAIEALIIENPLSTDYEARKAEVKAAIAALTKSLAEDFTADAKAKIAVLEAELKELYAALYDLVMATADDVSPLLADMLKDSIVALYDVLGLLEDAGVDYGAWLGDHFAPLAGELLASFLENSEELLNTACPIIDALIIKMIKDIDEFVKNAIEQLEAQLKYQIEELNKALEELKKELEDLYKELEDAVGEAKKEIEEKIEEIKDKIAELEDQLANTLVKLLEKLTAALERTDALLGELLGTTEGNLIDKLKVLIENMDVIKDALFADIKDFIDTGLYEDYVRGEDSYYLAIGGLLTGEEDYAAILAEKLGVPYGALAANLRASDLRALLDAAYINDAYGLALFEGIDVEALRAIYLEEIAKADLITLDFGNADFTTFATSQLLSYIVEQNKETLAPVAGLLELDLSVFKAYDLDWTRFAGFVDYVDVEAVLAAAEAELVKNGLPEVYVYETTVSELLGFDVTAIMPDDKVVLEIYPADIAMYAVECYLYAYVNYAYNFAATIDAIHAVNPEAEVVVLGTFNALEGLVIDLGGDVLNVSDIAEAVVGGMNAFSLATVLSMENTTYVDISDVESVLEAEKDEAEIFDYVSLEVLGFNPAALNASAAGHAYIAEQIAKAFTLGCTHVYDDACDAECNICGEAREVGDHEYDNACDAECNICGEVREVGAHEYDNACDADCNICGEKRTPAAHKYANACDADCDVCGEKRTPAAHKYANACDADCDVCGEKRTPAAHKYANDCDADCDVCGEKRTPAAHKYANDCDADCDVCGEKRTPAAHKYANDCDADCDVCGEKRTPAEHKYDNDCDKDCNVCGAERTPAEHKYDNACDADCNVCGEKRTPAEHKFGEWKTVTEATKDAEGKQERTCSVCGHVESQAIPVLTGGMPVAVIVVIVVVGVAGVGTGAFFILKKFSII